MRSSQPWVPSKLHVANSEFLPPPNEIPSALTSMIDQVKSEIFPTVRRQITEYFESHQKDNLSQSERRAMNFLRNHQNEYLAVESDKNLGLAIMDRPKYDEAVLSALNDGKTYTEQFEDAETILSRTFDSARELLSKHREFFTSKERKFLGFYYSEAKRTYFKLSPFRLLPKVHKIPISFRGIVNAILAVTTPFSKIINERLQGLMRQQKTFIADSTSMVRLLESLPIPISKRRGPISIFVYDVISLYPSIPLELALKMIFSLLLRFGLDSHACYVLVEILEFILKNNYISFKDRIWLQIFGTAMGTSAAPVFASLFMAELEQPWLEEFESIFHIIKRFLDDGVGITFANAVETKHMLDKFNTLNPNIQITYSISETSAIFLDLEIFRDDSFMDTGLFRTRTFFKPMNKFLYLPQNSFHPPRVKINFIRTEILRYLRLSSLEKDFYNTVDLFFNRLTARGYSAKQLQNILASISFADRQAALTPKPKRILRQQESDSTQSFYFVTRLNSFSKSFNYSKLLNETFAKFNKFQSFDISCNTAFSYPKKLLSSINSK
jgi:hypothetical protein